MPSERDLLNNIPNKLNLYFVPSSWAARLAQQAYNEGLIPSQYGLTKLLQVFLLLRASQQSLKIFLKFKGLYELKMSVLALH